MRAEEASFLRPPIPPACNERQRAQASRCVLEMYGVMPRSLKRPGTLSADGPNQRPRPTRSPASKTRLGRSGLTIRVIGRAVIHEIFDRFSLPPVFSAWRIQLSPRTSSGYRDRATCRCGRACLPGLPPARLRSAAAPARQDCSDASVGHDRAGGRVGRSRKCERRRSVKR